MNPCYGYLNCKYLAQKNVFVVPFAVKGLSGFKIKASNLHFMSMLVYV